MAFKIDTANDLDDLYEKMEDFVLGAGDVATPSFTGTGDGTMTPYRSLPAAPAETWTITATSATNFTVTGSVSGAQAAATVDIAYDNGILSFTINDGGVAFVATDEFSVVVTEGAMQTQGDPWTEIGVFRELVQTNYVGVGGGVVQTTSPVPISFPGAPSETWTITAIDANNFTVVGSVSGAQANLGVFADYVNPFITLQINTGSPAFVIGDEFTFVVRKNGTAFKALGLSGTDEIYINARKFRNDSLVNYSIGFRGALGYDSNAAYEDQTFTSRQTSIATWDQSMPYWFYGNGRRLVMIVNVSTVYHSSHAGWLLPTSFPAEYLNPLYLSATEENTTASGIDWSSTLGNVGGFFAATSTSSWLNSPANVWLDVSHLNTGGSLLGTEGIWPWSGAGDVARIFKDVVAGLDGASRLLLQATVHAEQEGGNIYGALDGVFWINGFDGMSPEDTFIDGGDTYDIFNNVFRNGPNDFVAIKRE